MAKFLIGLTRLPLFRPRVGLLQEVSAGCLQITRGYADTPTRGEKFQGAEASGKYFSNEDTAKKIRWGRVCIKAPRRTEYKCDPPFAKVGHWLTREDCNADPCYDAFPPFDKLYYKPSNKAKRRYQQTWSECPKLVVEPMPLCKFVQVKALPMKKRTLEDIKKLYQGGSAVSTAAFKDKKNICPKMNMAYCKPVRATQKCLIDKAPLDCAKPKCPYPSFSECTRDRPRPRNTGECGCLRVDSMCEVYAQMRAQAVREKGSR